MAPSFTYSPFEGHHFILDEINELPEKVAIRKGEDVRMFEQQLLIFKLCFLFIH